MRYPAIAIDRDGNVTVAWPLDAADELAHLLLAEGARTNDRGWADDGASILDAIGEWRAARSPDPEDP